MSDELAFTESGMRKMVASLVGVNSRPLNKEDFHGSILVPEKYFVGHTDQEAVENFVDDDDWAEADFSNAIWIHF